MSNENNKCCFCFNLRTGSLIVGYISLLYIIGVTIYLTYIWSTIEVPRTLMASIYLKFGKEMLLCILILVLTIALIVGLHQHIPDLVMAFIKLQYMILMGRIIHVFLYWSDYDSRTFSIHLLIFIITIFFVAVLKRYHDNMKMVELGSGVNTESVNNNVA